ncbi:MAG: sigma-E processing peptidase SpoIIGA [Clostridia bacterium]|nr:sigma-E processing peptidase SpoIIGA [Clostridia bacterium]
MTVDIYADEMIFINFIVNVLTIEITKRIVKHKVSLLRESILAFIFSLLYTVFVISDLRGYINLFTLLVINICELVILFKPKDIVQCVKYSIAFKFAAITTNGCSLLMNNYLKNRFNYLILMLSFALTYLSYIILNLLNRETAYYSIDIQCSNKIININALVDTGNSLVEPLSNKPVIVAEYSALKEVLPYKLVEIYENKKESNLMEIISAISEDSFRNSLRIIPFKSVGREKGMMIGFVADSVKIKDNVISKPVIGICRFNLSRNGLYSALISPRHLGGI